MNIAMDAIGKKGEYTPVENCKAKDPMKCPYHGASAIKKFLDASSSKGVKFDVLKSGNGKFNVVAKVKKGDKGMMDDVDSCLSSLHKKLNGDVAYEAAKLSAKGDAAEKSFSVEVDDLAGIKEDYDDLSGTIFGDEEAYGDLAEQVMAVESAIDNFEKGVSTKQDAYAKLSTLKEDVILKGIKDADELDAIALPLMMKEVEAGGFAGLPNVVLDDPIHVANVVSDLKDAAKALLDAQGEYAMASSDDEASLDLLKNKYRELSAAVAAAEEASEKYDALKDELKELKNKPKNEPKNESKVDDGAGQEDPIHASPSEPDSYGYDDGLQQEVSDAEWLLKPIEHDDSKFPKFTSEKELLDAITDSSSAGGGGGLGTQIVKIGDRKYVMKKGSGDARASIENGFDCDMAYRAGGINAPDAKLYHFGDKVYKLAEFIEGNRLDSLVTKDEKTGAWNVPQSVRDELLKGYPLDVLFSNWDVLGTNEAGGLRYTNIIVDKDGKCWRIDNDGAFAMTGLVGGKKSCTGKIDSIRSVEYDKWSDWKDRAWIDDFRTMRVAKMNQGVFDGYTTHGIFEAAGHINYGNVVKNLPQGTKDALAKPLKAMRDMARDAKGAKLAGYRGGTEYRFKDSNGKDMSIGIDSISDILDTIYDARKFNAEAFLEGQSTLLSHYTSKSKKFPKPKPVPPVEPGPGLNYANEVLEGVKTIAYHVASGDYTPNMKRIERALGVKPQVKALAEQGNEKAKKILDAITKIEKAQETGFKEALKFDTPNGLFDAKGLSLVANQSQIDEFKKQNHELYAKYEKDLDKWKHEEAEWIGGQKGLSANGTAFTNYEDFMKHMVIRNGNTDGVAMNNGSNEPNSDSKISQKSCSWESDACKKKVRQYVMMGIPLDEMKFGNNNLTFYNGNISHGGKHVSGTKEIDEKVFFKAVDYYRNNPSELKKDMQAYAKHKAMLVLAARYNGSESIDSTTDTIFALRSEHKPAFWHTGFPTPSDYKKIIPVYPIDSASSMAVEGKCEFGNVLIGYKMPIWRINDIWFSGSENEVSFNAIRIPYPPVAYAKGSYYSDCRKHYESMKEVQDISDAIKKRMATP